MKNHVNSDTNLHNAKPIIISTKLLTFLVLCTLLKRCLFLGFSKELFLER
jgi:hypothetical protein